MRTRNDIIFYYTMKGGLEMDFTYEPNRISLISDNNNLLAEVTFPDVDEKIVNINHTYVDESLRGQGIAGRLMEAAAGLLQKQNKKVVLTCPYAIQWFSRHHEYSDLVK